jgi:hypothetical protein
VFALSLQFKARRFTAFKVTVNRDRHRSNLANNTQPFLLNACPRQTESKT